MKKMKQLAVAVSTFAVSSVAMAEATRASNFLSNILDLLTQAKVILPLFAMVVGVFMAIMGGMQVYKALKGDREAKIHTGAGMMFIGSLVAVISGVIMMSAEVAGVDEGLSQDSFGSE